MRINLSRLLLSCGAIFATSCASDVANRYYGSDKFPPKKIEDVQLLDRAPNRPYIVIADFQSRGESPENLREKAAAIGADGVIVTTLGGYADSQHNDWLKANANNSYTRIVGTAIHFK